MLVLDSSSRGKPALNFAERRETKSTSIHNIKCSPLSTTRIIAHTFLNLCLSVSHSHSHSHSLTIIYSLSHAPSPALYCLGYSPRLTLPPPPPASAYIRRQQAFALAPVTPKPVVLGPRMTPPPNPRPAPASALGPASPRAPSASSAWAACRSSPRPRRCPHARAHLASA